ncbi:MULTISPECIES: N-acetylmuramidase domain-containing protein [unclassified Bradyrhizobium]|uniref:N-acetylmuramidase domain-containing protein n=1 Tax=unclassified Bradyrhizobium TaxID=2631580 RepID=UPI002916618F|nr:MULTISPECIES: N-acetylmuramidase domain-containing protein [unclassified Bradyrhizobium]
MFSQAIVTAISDAAAKAGIDRAALLALVEVETAGHAFEQDGRTPALLYERHVAWRQAAKVSKALQSAFARAGLAIPKWSRATQYKDQGTSAGRLAVIAKARGLDAEVADQSASWGLGQTMGFLHAELGFESAAAMVDHMTGNITGQIECLISELKNKHLIAPLNAGRWAEVAKGYNGAGYAANRYDVRLADACKRWERKLANPAVAVAPDMAADDIKALQIKLRKLGYAGVGAPDGRFGVKTVGALSAFQAHEGVPVTGKLDDPTREALKTAQPIEAPRERAQASAGELKAAGSRTVAATDSGSVIAWATKAAGAVMVGGGAADKAGLLDTAQGVIDKANQAKGIYDSALDLGRAVFAGPAPIVAGLVLIAAGLGAWFLFARIRACRVADHNSGVHAGPASAEG